MDLPTQFAEQMDTSPLNGVLTDGVPSNVSLISVPTNDVPQNINLSTISYTGEFL